MRIDGPQGFGRGRSACLRTAAVAEAATQKRRRPSGRASAQEALDGSRLAPDLAGVLVCAVCLFLLLLLLDAGALGV